MSTIKGKSIDIIGTEEGFTTFLEGFYRGLSGRDDKSKKLLSLGDGLVAKAVFIKNS